MKNKFELRFPIDDFSKDGNKVFHSQRISKISLHVLLVWLDRFVIKEGGWKDSPWFGGKINNSDYVFWFQNDRDLHSAEIFLNNIKEDGYPRHSTFHTI